MGYGDLDLLKSFRSDIQDSGQGGLFESLQTTSAPERKWDWAKLVGRHWGDIKIQNC